MVCLFPSHIFQHYILWLHAIFCKMWFKNFSSSLSLSASDSMSISLRPHWHIFVRLIMSKISDIFLITSGSVVLLFVLFQLTSVGWLVLKYHFASNTRYTFSNRFTAFFVLFSATICLCSSTVSVCHFLKSVQHVPQFSIQLLSLSILLFTSSTRAGGAVNPFLISTTSHLGDLCFN